MRWRDFDLGAVIAFLLAAAMTVLMAIFLLAYFTLPLFWILFFGPTVAAWTAFWAWRRQRYLVAAGMFLLSLPYWVSALLFPPTLLTLGMFVLALLSTLKIRATSGAGRPAARRARERRRGRAPAGA